MYVSPSPHLKDDPFWAVRLALIVAVGFVVVEIIKPHSYTVFIAIIIRAADMQRKAFSPKAFLPMIIIFIIVTYSIAYLLNYAGNVSLGFLLIIVTTLCFCGIYFSSTTGSSVGKIILMVTAIFSFYAVKSPTVLKGVSEDIVKALLVAGALIIVGYLIIPAKTHEVHVPKSQPPTGEDFKRSLIRTVVLMFILLWSYAILNSHDIYLILAATYALAYTTTDSAYEEAEARIVALIYGAISAGLMLIILQFNASMMTVVFIYFFVCLHFGSRMMHGQLSESAYHSSMIVFSSFFLNTIYRGDEAYLMVQRAGFTIIGLSIAVFVVALLDSIFLKDAKA